MIVAPVAPMASSRLSGDARSSNTTLARAAMGKHTSPPSPKVNAIGGVPMHRSLAVMPSTCSANPRHIAITSRWKCMHPFGTPVVPDVNAMRATSSLAVATAGKAPVCRAMARSSVSAPSPPQQRTARMDVESAAALASSSSSRASHRAALHCARSITMRSSPARSIGIVLTATMPALSVASHATVMKRPLKPRHSTRFPDTRPRSCTSTCASAST